MQNLSLNELVEIERTNNILLNALEQIAIARNIKNYKDISQEDLLLALIKSNESYTELLKREEISNTEIGENKELFNKLRSNFSREKIKAQRRKFHKKEVLKNCEEVKKDRLTVKQEKILKNVVNYF